MTYSAESLALAAAVDACADAAYDEDDAAGAATDAGDVDARGNGGGGHLTNMRAQD